MIEELPNPNSSSPEYLNNYIDIVNTEKHNQPKFIGSKHMQASDDFKNPNTNVKPRVTGKKNECIGRDDKVDADMYYRVKDENDHLKKQQLLLNDQLKKLQIGLEKVKHDVQLGRKQKGGEIEVEIDTIKMENEKLKDQANKMRIIIKGMETELAALKSRKLNTGGQSEFEKEKGEYLALIKLLRERLKQANDDFKQITAEIKGDSKQIMQVGEYAKDLREKTAQIAELTSKYEKTQVQFKTNVKILDITKKSLEEYIAQFKDQRKKNQDLEHEVQILHSELDHLPEYVSRIEEHKRKEIILEQKINDLCEDPFLRPQTERELHLKLKENELALAEATRRLKLLEQSLCKAEEENSSLKDKFKIIEIDNEKYKDEALQYKLSNTEKENIWKNFGEQLQKFGQYGEVNSDLCKILELLRVNQEENHWTKIDFLEKDLEGKDPTEYIKEIQRLQIEKGILGTELEKTKSLLQIQQQLNEDIKSVEEYDMKKTEAENKHLRKKIEELSKLLDIEKASKDYLRLSGDFSKDISKHDLIPQDQVVNLMSDVITEFSKDETETDFGMNENSLDLYIGNAIFEDDITKDFKLNMVTTRSFVTVDFYLHETQTSNLFTGGMPNYNLQASFKVSADEHFFNYIETDYIIIDVYVIRSNVQSLVGRGKISLKELIEAEKPIKDNFISSSRVVKGICPLLYSKDQTISIGKLNYKMRMRSPISQALRWYRDEKHIVKVQANEESSYKKISQELLAVNKFTKGKIMQVKILVSKATALTLTGPIRNIQPYFYYKFHQQADRISKSSLGRDPIFDDEASYTVVYDRKFHELIEKEYLEIYLMDANLPLEAEMQQDTIDANANAFSLIEHPDIEDFIGICKIPYVGLLINNTIQGAFPIYNSQSAHCGDLEVKICWEEILMEYKTLFPADEKSYDDALLMKLAKILKNKNLNVHSAFELFDIDNKQVITLVNFKDTLLFTLKFTSNHDELQHITFLIFNGRSFISKLDFYKIFSILLLKDDPQEMISCFHSHREKKIAANQIVQNMTINISPIYKTDEDNTTNDIEKKTILAKSQTVASPRGKESLRSSSNEMRESKRIPPKMILIQNSNREMKEIIKTLNYYMIRTGKHSSVEIYKMMDQDADLKVGRAELANGFAKMGIPLSSQELEKIWKAIVESNVKMEKFDFKDFKRFFEKHKDSSLLNQ